MHRCRFFSALTICSLFLVAASGCHPLVPTEETSVASQKESRLLAIPFTNVAAIFGTDKSVKGPATGQAFVTGMVTSDAAERLDTALQQILSRQSDLQWRVDASGGGLLSSAEILNRDAHVKALCDAGRTRGAHAVLTGYVYTFQERRGGDFSVDQPAEVTIELVLIHVPTRQVLWQGKYSERQQPLNENLMAIGKFLERRGRWVTALDLATPAMEKMVDDMLKTVPF
jgi:hypothetical protein